PTATTSSPGSAPARCEGGARGVRLLPPSPGRALEGEGRRRRRRGGVTKHEIKSDRCAGETFASLQHALKRCCFTLCHPTPARKSAPTLPFQAGLSHMSEQAEKEGIVPACTLDFLPDREGRRVGAQDVECEPADRCQIFRTIVLSGPAAIFVEEDI